MRRLNFPVLLYTDKFVQGRIPTQRELTLVSEKNYAAGCLENAFIIDANGTKYRVRSHKIQRHRYSFWDLFEKYRSVYLQLELEYLGVLNPGAATKDLADWIIKRGWYTSDYNMSADKFRRKLSKCRTVEELVNVIDVYP